MPLICRPRSTQGAASPYARREISAEARDAQPPLAPWSGHHGDVADLAADQRLRHRRLGREPAACGVGLGRADDRVDGFAAGFLVDDVHGAAERDLLRALLRLDHARGAQALLQALDA